MSELHFTPILHPPLGASSTCFQNSPVKFHALMQIDASKDIIIDPAERFTVLLWYSTNGRGTWTPAPFKEIPLDDGWEEMKRPGRRDLFLLDLDYDSKLGPLQFCLKYRFGDGPWLWAGSRVGGVDGRVVFQGPWEYVVPEDIIQLVPESGWDVHAITIKDKYRIVEYGCSAKGEGVLELPFGKSVGLVEQWMALVKIATPWMGPLHGTKNISIQKDALLTMFQRAHGGFHVVLLPVSGLEGGSAYLTSDSEQDGRLIIRSMGDHEKSHNGEREVKLLIGFGPDPHETVACVFNHLKRKIKEKYGGDSDSYANTTDSSTNLEDSRKSSPWKDGLSYCTWNGLGWDLSEERILNALEDLEQSGVKVTNLVIDDNWQTLAGRNYGSSGTWSSFEANEKFPGGLKGIVSKVRERFPKIRHIGVWHALHGYWDGITPNSTLGGKYKTVEVAWRDNVNSVTKNLTMVDPKDIERFYDDFYNFLSESGIDCVKTDVQCRIEELISGADKAKLAGPYQEAFRKSAIKYFDQRAIYCMSHVPQILYTALLRDDGLNVFLRTSDDFYPNVPQSHAWHIFANAMNMILFSQLHILPDWDMFQTSLPQYASIHAAARCLSGGPVFITDSPESHDQNLVSSMVSPILSVKTPPRILRPSGMAYAVDPYLGYHSSRLLCVKNSYSNASGKMHLLGVFNVSTTDLVELLGTFWPRGEEWVIRGHNSQKVKKPEGELMAVGLEAGDWEIFTAAPVKDKVAVLGLKENMTGATAISRWSVKTSEGIREIEVELRALGTLVIYIEDLESGAIPPIKGNSSSAKLQVEVFPVVHENYLEVALLKRWEDALEGFDSEIEMETLTCTISINATAYSQRN
ncbi:glycoside hydrolase [Choiromyces venosus 120613-1]|uniref:Glycoside hydrolase n=1 Tax=Choiromyces venosus 120613-1 TaxID=1336337 RepID=A0A3N4K9C1_9PEZI|nr:glycoside hydrolase [Choiromyces venosus 120613-1]